MLVRRLTSDPGREQLGAVTERLCGYRGNVPSGIVPSASCFGTVPSPGG